MVARLLIAAFLLVHGLIHTGFIAPAPPATAGGPPWPFDLRHSWLLSPLGLDAGLTRTLGTALVATTIAGFALAAIAGLAVMPDAVRSAGVVVGAVSSLALIGLFFHPWLAVGVAIDLYLLWSAVVTDWG